MLRKLAQQDEELYSKVLGRPCSMRDLGRQPEVALDILDATAGIILDSAPSRLTPDIAAR